MILCCIATWFMISRTPSVVSSTHSETIRKALDASHQHRRDALSFVGWLGLMAGIAGLMQAHYAQEVVPNALYGRELDVLAATVLGGARLGGGKGSVIGCCLAFCLFQ